MNNVIDTSSMFEQCVLLTELIKPDWDMRFVKNDKSMYSKCKPEIIPDRYKIYYDERLTENRFAFNPLDYDDNDDIIPVDNISKMLFKYCPQSKEELQKVIEEIAETTDSRILNLS